MYFAVKLSANDQPILEELRTFFGVGAIYNVKARAPTKRSGASKTASYYRVTHRADLQRIVEHFDQYPLKSSKHRVYEIWRVMVQMKLQFRRPDRDTLNMLAEQLSARVGRNQPC